MASKPEGGVKRLIRFLALGLPTLSRIIAVALVAAAVAVAFFDVGDYATDNERATDALLMSGLALLALVIGSAIPAIIRRTMP